MFFLQNLTFISADSPYHLLVTLMVKLNPFRPFEKIKAKSLSLGNSLVAVHL